MYNNSIDGIMFETFSIIDNETTIELKKDGNNIDVTDNNKNE
jgi:hypothetical protein